MAIFRPNVPVETREPFIEVEGLRIGVHKFQLVVEDAAGNASQPDEITLTVRRRPIVDPVGPVGPVRPVGPIGPVNR